ncbi:MAG: type II toxin-antitoxin system VapC family toxin [Nocardiopsaceae bacterium]|nr:type II toxin-antitoxin system VapC family toxin [Nocardiopsaceae bacterium]
MIVLDASALVDVVLDQPAAAWVLDQISDEGIRSPSHQPAEVLSALSRLVRDGLLGSREALDALHEASALPQQLVTPTPAHLQRAFALRGRIRVLDGLYVALAEELGCALVTTDSRLSRAAAPCEVRAPG